MFSFNIVANGVVLNEMLRLEEFPMGLHCFMIKI